MRLPKNGSIVDISGHEYTVRYVKGLHGVDGKSLWGHFKAHTGEILIEKEQPERCKRNTFIHEITHGILEHSGYGGTDEDERIASAVAYGLESVRVDGKPLLK